MSVFKHSKNAILFVATHPGEITNMSTPINQWLPTCLNLKYIIGYIEVNCTHITSPTMQQLNVLNI